MLKRIVIILVLSALNVFGVKGSTAVIAGASITSENRPILWGSIDSDNDDVRVEYVEGENGEHSYVALFYSDDKFLSSPLIGMNNYGFAILSCNSTNLEDDGLHPSKMNREGRISEIALKSCKSIDDFADLLERLPKPLGVQANFGVIDCYGDGAFFETDNNHYVKFDLKDNPQDLLIRTNYSRSGRKNEGEGYIREKNVMALLEPFIETKEISSEIFTEYLSNSFYNDLLQKDFSISGDHWVADSDFISAYNTIASVAVEGCVPISKNENPSKRVVEKEYLMWTSLGYPPCSEIFSVKCAKNGVPEDLQGISGSYHSPQSDRVKERRNDVFHFPGEDGKRYIDMTKLMNNQSTGYIQTLRPLNIDTYRIVRSRREK